MGGEAEDSRGGHFMTPLLGKRDGGSHVSTASTATSADDSDNDASTALLCKVGKSVPPAKDWRKKRTAQMNGPDAVRRPAQSVLYPQAY
jgi:hypothetical protein